MLSPNLINFIFPEDYDILSYNLETISLKYRSFWPFRCPVCKYTTIKNPCFVSNVTLQQSFDLSTSVMSEKKLDSDSHSQLWTYKLVRLVVQ